jgi:hypothetical protein
MKTRVLILFILAASTLFPLGGCGSTQATTAPLPTATPRLTPIPTSLTTAPPATLPDVIPQLTATPTATSLAGLVAPTPLPEPTGGEVEIRIPFTIVAGGEAVPADIPDCTNAIPFAMTADGTRTMIDGEGRIDCHFVDTPSGQPITFHVILEYDAVLAGELLPPTPEQPSEWLDAYLTIDGAIVQFYSGYPPEAQNPCPEDNPCRTAAFEVIPLPLAYKEGSTITEPWTFVLHLK